MFPHSKQPLRYTKLKSYARAGQESCFVILNYVEIYFFNVSMSLERTENLTRKETKSQGERLLKYRE